MLGRRQPARRPRERCRLSAQGAKRNGAVPSYPAAVLPLPGGGLGGRSAPPTGNPSRASPWGKGRHPPLGVPRTPARGRGAGGRLGNHRRSYTHGPTRRCEKSALGLSSLAGAPNELAGAGGEGTWGEMKRPKSVVWGVIFLWASLAIGLVVGIAGVTTGSIEARLAGIPNPVIFLIVVLGFVVAVISFLVSKISAGKNWARITLFALFAAGLPFLPSSGAIAIFQAGVGFVLLFVPVSNEWFRLMRVSRLAEDLRKIGDIHQGR